MSLAILPPSPEPEPRDTSHDRFCQRCDNRIHHTLSTRYCAACNSIDAMERIERMKDDASKQDNFQATHLPDGRLRKFTLESYEGNQPWLN